VSAFGARAVSRGQRDGFVEEEQRRIAVGIPLSDSAAPERQSTDDPGLVLMISHDVAGATALVQAAAVAHPRAAARHGDDVSQG